MSFKNIVWLASYPKSGNTWSRIFLANYLLNATEPVPINQVHRIGIGDSVAKAYTLVNNGRYDPMDYIGHLKLREKVMRGITGNGADINFVKTHSLNDLAFGYRLIDPAFTRSAVYILRHPYDVAISYARHYGVTPSKACEAISRGDNTTMADATSVKQYIGSWSDHVTGWTRTKKFPVLTLRYEDLKTDPHGAFREMLEFLSVTVDDERLDRAVRFSSFDELRKQEDKEGFIERSKNTERFFHTGTSGQWEGVLSADDIALLTKAHGRVMKRFGYL